MRLGLLPGHVPLYFALEFLPGHLACLVHPGCTIEPLTVRTCHSHQLSRLGPPDLPEVAFGYPRQVLMDGHDVVSLPARLRKASLQELVERLQSLQAPILADPNLA